MDDIILCHEDIQDASLWDFLFGVWHHYRQKGHLAPLENVSKGIEVPAYINHGRWVAECPSGDGGALNASKTTPLFMCPVCWNKEANGKWLEVVFPKNGQAIEEVLLKRPDPLNRNWRKGESLPSLRSENKRHGVEV